MQTKGLKGLLASAAVAATMGLGAVAHADPVFDPNDFYVVETAGQYTVFNNSDDWYIYAFSVTNPDAYYGYAWTDRDDWSAYSCTGSCSGPLETPFYSYYDYRFDGHLNDTAANLIAPHTSSGQFYFSTAVASTYAISIFDGSNSYQTFTGEARAPGGGVPEPATWALLILGFGATGALARRRRRIEVA